MAKLENRMKEMYEQVLKGTVEELSLPEKARAYCLLRELIFWEEVIDLAQKRTEEIRQFLSGTIPSNRLRKFVYGNVSAKKSK